MGGWESAKEMVAARKLAPESVKFFSKYCGWGPGQLDQVRVLPHCLRSTQCIAADAFVKSITAFLPCYFNRFAQQKTPFPTGLASI